jgi:hypothetical protein
MNKTLLSLLLLIISFNSNALDSSYSAEEKSFMNSVVGNLGITGKEDKDNAKKAIFYEIDYIFDYEIWSSHGTTESSLNISKIKSFNSHDITFNTKGGGLIFLSFVLDKSVKQISLTTRQIRHGTKEDCLALYKKRKTEEEDGKKVYSVLHESKNYALFRKSPYQSFTSIDIQGDTGTITYMEQRIISY